MLFIVVKWQSLYGVHNVHTPLLGRCVRAGIFVPIYGATNLAPAQNEKPLLFSKRRPHFLTYKRSWNEHKFDDVSRRGPKPRTTVLARVRSSLLDSKEWNVKLTVCGFIERPPLTYWYSNAFIVLLLTSENNKCCDVNIFGIMLNVTWSYLLAGSRG
jgi:hypothetical protein